MQLMKAGNLVRHRFSESGMTGVVIKKGHSDRWLVTWSDGRISWAVLTLLETLNESR